MSLLKWLPLRVVDKLLLLMANLLLGNTDHLGLRRPKTGPIELKNITGKTPVLDVGALSHIKSGNIKVLRRHFKEKLLFWLPPKFVLCSYLQTSAYATLSKAFFFFSVSGDAKC